MDKTLKGLLTHWSSKMYDTIEITFVDVRVEDLSLFIKDFISSSNGVSEYQIQANESDLIFDATSSDRILNIVKEISDGAIYLIIDKIDYQGLKLNTLDFQILKYSGNFDLNVLCEHDMLFRERSVEYLQKWASAIATKLKAKTYYCGYEPACDKSTRFFSENILGPIK